METKTKPLRCAQKDCKKKLGLLPFHCKCEKDYCANHRAPELHNCKFNYHEDAKKSLLKYMSTAIVGQKIEAI